VLDPKSKVRYRRPGKGPPWKRKKKQYEVVKLYNPGDPPECEYCQERVEKLWKKGTISVPLHKGCTCKLTKPYWVSKKVYEGKKGPPTKKYGGEMKRAQVFDREVEEGYGHGRAKCKKCGVVWDLDTIRERPDYKPGFCPTCGGPLKRLTEKVKGADTFASIRDFALSY